MPKITEMYAFICEETPGDEGIPALSAGGMMMPLTGADMDRVESLKPVAQRMANIGRLPMKIVKFTHMEQIGEILPE